MDNISTLFLRKASGAYVSLARAYMEVVYGMEVSTKHFIAIIITTNKHHSLSPSLTYILIHIYIPVLRYTASVFTSAPRRMYACCQRRCSWG
ncbi:hypothetical protein EON65_09850 [archaeon]|nr:MAG: hypothetical protein EON65_09850 [archaeon]